MVEFSSYFIIFLFLSLSLPLAKKDQKKEKSFKEFFSPTQNKELLLYEKVCVLFLHFLISIPQ